MAIKVNWDKQAKQTFKDWLHAEIANTEGNRGDLEAKWIDDIEQWRSRVRGGGVGEVPFVGASDLEFPLTAIHYDPVYSDFMTTLHAADTFWSIEGKRPETIDIAKPVQQFLALVERNFLKMRRVNKKVFTDIIIHGTGVYKTHIRSRRRKPVRGGELVVDSLRRPQVQPMPLQDLWFPAESWSLSADAPYGASQWVAQRTFPRKEQLKERARALVAGEPFYDRSAVDKVLTWETDVEDSVRDKIYEEDQYEPWREMRVEVFEVWARFDVDADGIEEDVVVQWHQDSGTILRAVHAPFDHGERPFHTADYLPGLGLLGIGIAEQDEPFQIAASRLFNSMLDSALLANSVMLSVPAGMHISPDEPIYPGKIWQMAPGERVTAVQMGRPYQAMLPMLQTIMQMSEQRTGANELKQGDISAVPSRTPADSLRRLQAEGNKRFDMALGNLREGALADIGQQTMQLLVQLSKNDPFWLELADSALGPADAEAVSLVLQGDVEEVSEMFGFKVTATSARVNAEQDKVDVTTLSQQLQQSWQVMLQYAQMLQDPMLMQETAASAYNGNQELMKRLIEAFGIENPDVYVPRTPAQMPQQPGAQAPAGGAPVGGAPAVVGGAPAPPAVDPTIAAILGGV
ncbi:MAG: hypothetical protein R3268_00760 [Acidiferrobacterales bacterium]|nr:hypothetical protein [Acidiferrobacterales bacterium]